MYFSISLQPFDMTSPNAHAHTHTYKVRKKNRFIVCSRVFLTTRYLHFRFVFMFVQFIEEEEEVKKVLLISVLSFTNYVRVALVRHLCFAYKIKIEEEKKMREIPKKRKENTNKKNVK